MPADPLSEATLDERYPRVGYMVEVLPNDMRVHREVRRCVACGACLTPEGLVVHDQWHAWLSSLGR